MKRSTVYAKFVFDLVPKETVSDHIIAEIDGH
jgi:hypothetical protein